MAQLHFTCPATKHRAPTGIETDMQSLRASWHATLKVDCPHCGGQHDIAVRDIYVDSALDELLLRPSRRDVAEKKTPRPVKPDAGR